MSALRSPPLALLRPTATAPRETSANPSPAPTRPASSLVRRLATLIVSASLPDHVLLVACRAYAASCRTTTGCSTALPAVESVERQQVTRPVTEAVLLESQRPFNIDLHPLAGPQRLEPVHRDCREVNPD